MVSKEMVGREDYCSNKSKGTRSRRKDAIKENGGFFSSLSAKYLFSLR